MIKRYTATEKQQLWLTKKNAGQLLNITPSKIEFVVPVGNGMVMVGTWNDSFYLPEDDFKYLYRDGRRQRALSLPVQQINKFEYNVNTHRVTITPSWQTCDCADFAEQKQKMGHAECKHIIATLNTMGYNSLASYILC